MRNYIYEDDKNYPKTIFTLIQIEISELLSQVKFFLDQS